MTNTLTYKNWGLTIFLRGAFGFDLFNVHDFYWGIPSMQSNVLKKAYTKNAAIKKGKNVLTDYFIERGDYVKLDMVNPELHFPDQQMAGQCPPLRHRKESCHHYRFQWCGS